MRDGPAKALPEGRAGVEDMAEGGRAVVYSSVDSSSSHGLWLNFMMQSMEGSEGLRSQDGHVHHSPRCLTRVGASRRVESPLPLP